jgi:hypothetical protein
MRKLAWFACCLGAVAIATTASADKKSTDPKTMEKKAASDPQAMDQEAMMKEWMEKYGIPGKEHKQLEYFAGTWSVTNTSYWGPAPEVTTGTSRGELKMGGRYLHQSYESEMSGMPFEGFGIFGYDRVSGEFFNYWFDSMGTGCMAARGHASADGKSWELKADCNDPMMGGMTSYRMITTIADNDNYSFVMYSTPPGQKESKSMEIKYTRVKSS